MITALVFALVLGLAGATCSNQCSGHGTCGTEDTCECFPRWTGPDCSARECPYGPSWVTQLKTEAHIGPATGVLGGRHGYKVCSSKGICSGESGECECFQGYTGLACSRQECPEDCSGHGRCITNKQANSKYSYTNSFVSQFWDAAMTRMCTCDRGWEGYSCSDRICPSGADPLTCDQRVHNPTVQRITLANMDFPFHKDNLFKIAISLTFTDMFNGRYSTQPIRLKGKSRGLKNEGTYNGRQVTLRPCAGLPVADALDFTKCSKKGPWTALNQYDDTTGKPYVAGAGEPLEDYDANHIRYALQSLPNFAVPSVNVTDAYPIDGTATDVEDIRYNSRWYFDVTFTHPATSGEQELMECTIASPATDNAASSPRMSAPTIWEHTASMADCLECKTSGVDQEFLVDAVSTGGLCSSVFSLDTCDGGCMWIASASHSSGNGGHCEPRPQSCLRNDGFGNYVCDGAPQFIAVTGSGRTATETCVEDSAAAFVASPKKGCPTKRVDLIQGGALAVGKNDMEVWTASFKRFNTDMEFAAACTGGNSANQKCASQSAITDCSGDCFWDPITNDCCDTVTETVGGGGIITRACAVVQNTKFERADSSHCTNSVTATENTYKKCTGNCKWREGRVLVQDSQMNVDAWWMSPVELNPPFDGVDGTCGGMTSKEACDKSACFWIVSTAAGWSAGSGSSHVEATVRSARTTGVCVGKHGTQRDGAHNPSVADNSGFILHQRDAPSCTVSRVAVNKPALKHICSNRGLCEKGTGLCTCFEGYAGEDCSGQNIYF